MHLFVTTKGHKSWRPRSDFRGKKRLLLGAYPDVSFAKARDLRDDARRLLREQLDLGLEALKRAIAAHAAAGTTFVGEALKRDILPAWAGCRRPTSETRELLAAMGDRPPPR